MLDPVLLALVRPHFPDFVFFLLGHLLSHQVSLISDQEGTVVGDALLPRFGQVVVGILNCVFISEVVDAETAVATFVVGGGKCSELLLAGCVPNLQ